MQTQNRFETLQEDQPIKTIKAQTKATKNKTLSKQQGEEDKETQRADKNPVPTDYHGSENTTPEGLPLNRPEEPQIVSGSGEVVSEDMEIGDLDMD